MHVIFSAEVNRFVDPFFEFECSEFLLITKTTRLQSPGSLLGDIQTVSVDVKNVIRSCYHCVSYDGAACF